MGSVHTARHMNASMEKRLTSLYSGRKDEKLFASKKNIALEIVS